MRCWATWVDECRHDTIKQFTYLCVEQFAACHGWRAKFFNPNDGISRIHNMLERYHAGQDLRRLLDKLQCHLLGKGCE